MIYHITPAVSWDAARKEGVYRGDTLASQGFIHCSSSSQVSRVANNFYRGRTGLALLCIDPLRLKAPVKWENLEGGEEHFPHIYGALNLDAVEKVLDFSAGEDGIFEFSELGS
jgi:uncharacterized protein (DUF952 family)